MTATSNSHSGICPPARVEWTKGMQLGNGTFGEVYEAVPRKPGPIMAVKFASGEDAAMSLFHECQFLEMFQRARIPGVIRCIDGGEHESDPGTYYLLLEHAPKGSLVDFMDKFWIPDSLIRIFTRSILKTLKSIHLLGVVHCDVKPGNILVFPPPPGGGELDYELKLADFGLAVDMRDVNPGENNYRGTVRFMPPEMVVAGEVTPGMDVWALGCTVLQMITRDLPWAGWRKSEEELKEEIGKGGHPEIPKWVCEEGKDFLMRCFEKRLDLRPSAEVLLQHRFVGGRGLPGEEEKKGGGLMKFHYLPHLMVQQNRVGLMS